MAILLVRHGQASFGSDDYDRLSDAGHRQSARLGDWLARQPQRFDAVHLGAMRRHRETYEGIRAAFAAQGHALPEPVVSSELDEFDHQAVLRRFTERHPEHPATAVLRGGHAPEPRAVFALLHTALMAWVAGALDGVPETWADFQRRTRAAAARLARDAQHGEVLVVSSGDTISQLAQAALGIDDARAVALNLSLRNSALSELHALHDGLHLGSWNALPHLADDRSLWTHY